LLDAHAKSHAQDIEKRFNGSRISSDQAVLFGLSGSLIPRPAAITVLLLCRTPASWFRVSPCWRLSASALPLHW